MAIIEKTPEELALLKEWQNKLNLQDWYIILKTNCDPSEMALEDSDGCISFIEMTKAAEIQIADPNKCDSCTLRRPFNFEEILVHELLHLKFTLLAEGEDWDNSLQLRLLHQIIDDMARLLVSMKNEQKESTRT